MNYWAIFWGITILFSTVSFAYMSGKILYKSIFELKEMFRKLEHRHLSSQED